MPRVRRILTRRRVPAECMESRAEPKGARTMAKALRTDAEMLADEARALLEALPPAERGGTRAGHRRDGRPGGGAAGRDGVPHGAFRHRGSPADCVRRAGGWAVHRAALRSLRCAAAGATGVVGVAAVRARGARGEAVRARDE